MVGISIWNSVLVPGVFCPEVGVRCPRLPFHVVGYKGSTCKSHDCIHLMHRKVPARSITNLPNDGRAVKCASFVEGNYQPSDEDPYLINVVKQAMWGVKSVLLFLVEQPSQLKYIEWPGFQSTLKTATLALVLVGLFIIALSSVDSALSYMLTLFLRRTA